MLRRFRYHAHQRELMYAYENGIDGYRPSTHPFANQSMPTDFGGGAYNYTHQRPRMHPGEGMGPVFYRKD